MGYRAFTAAAALFVRNYRKNATSSSTARCKG